MIEKRTGARFLAETLKGYGVTHVFFVEAILRKTLVELEALFGTSSVFSNFSFQILD